LLEMCIGQVRVALARRHSRPESRGSGLF